jgi:integrase
MSYPEKRGGKLTGWWYGEARLKNGQRFRKRFQTKDGADGYEEYVTKHGREPEDEAQALPSAAVRTFRDVAKAAKAAGGPRGKWKRDRDGSLIQRLDYVVGVLGDLPITDVKRRDLQRIVESLEKRPGRSGKRLTGDTINRYLTAASAVLTFAEDEGYIEATPKVPWQAKGNRRVHWLTEDQEDTLCSHILERKYMRREQDIVTTIRVLARTGLRWGEMAVLEAPEVDIVDQYDEEGRKVLDESGKPTQEAWIRLWETKTDHPRSVPIDLELALELRRMLAGSGVPDYKTVYRAFKEAVKACGYNPRLTLHSLRHTTATRLVQRRENLAIVKDFLGHKNIQTTMIYTTVESRFLREAAKKLSPHRGKQGAEGGSGDTTAPEAAR